MTGLNLEQLKELVIVPTLAWLGTKYNSAAAINLLAGTALVESGLTYLHQLDNGPALGLWQMEPTTHDDCFINFLDFPENAALKSNIEDLGTTTVNSLIGNLNYACALARVKYWRAPAKLPAPTDAQGLAEYHKTYYNSAYGATDVASSALLFVQAIAA